MLNSHSEAYKSAGVDVTAGYRAVEKFSPFVKATHTDGVLGDIGGFGGLYMPDLSGMTRPVLVSGTDGVGTKLKLAFILDKHDTVGIDCVAMCVNDVICVGAKPLFFLDYIALGKNRPERVAEIVKGICDGCIMAQCALIGGETAEMPGFYPVEEYDLAGYCTGIVDYDKILGSKRVCEGDVLIGLPSSGVHSNGFSLVRKIFRMETEALSTYSNELSKTLGEALITPTRIYVKSALRAVNTGHVHAISHITGGGFYENIPRMLPKGLSVRIQKNSFEILPIFKMLMQLGNVPERDMFNTFNMGIGLVFAVDKDGADKVMAELTLAGEHPVIMGSVVSSDSGVELV